MTFFVPKGKKMRVHASDSWHDFASEEDLGPVKVYFEGGSVVITQAKDTVFLGAWGPGDWKNAEVLAAS